MIDQMVSDGADIVDIGGRSTRPGSVEISAEEELQRVMDVIRYIAKKYPNQWMSIDTTKAMVAHVAIQEGCRIINDISSGDMDQKMIETVSRLKVPYISMHMQGRPETMQVNPQYNAVIEEIDIFFNERIEKAIKLIAITIGKRIAKNFTKPHKNTINDQLPISTSIQPDNHNPGIVGIIIKSISGIKETASFFFNSFIPSISFKFSRLPA